MHQPFDACSARKSRPPGRSAISCRLIGTAKTCGMEKEPGQACQYCSDEKKRSPAVGPIRGEQSIDNHESRKDPDEAQHHVHESECLQTEFETRSLRRKLPHARQPASPTDCGMFVARTGNGDEVYESRRTPEMRSNMCCQLSLRWGDGATTGMGTTRASSWLQSSEQRMATGQSNQGLAVTMGGPSACGFSRSTTTFASRSSSFRRSIQ